MFDKPGIRIVRYRYCAMKVAAGINLPDWRAPLRSPRKLSATSREFAYIGHVQGMRSQSPRDYLRLHADCQHRGPDSRGRPRFAMSRLLEFECSSCTYRRSVWTYARSRWFPVRGHVICLRRGSHRATVMTAFQVISQAAYQAGSVS